MIQRKNRVQSRFFFILVPLFSKMKIKVLITFLIVIGVTRIYASPKDAETLYLEAKMIMNQDHEKSLELAFNALEYSEQNNEFHYELKSLFLIAWLHKRLDNIEKSIEFYFRIISVQNSIRSIDEKKILISTYKNLCLLINQYEEHDLADQLIQEAITLSKDLNDTSSIIKYTNTRLMVLMDQEDFQKVLLELEFLENELSVQDYEELTKVYLFKGQAYHNLGNYYLALNQYEKILLNPSSSDVDISGAYHQIAMIYDDLGEYQKGLNAAYKALTINSNSNYYESLFLNHTEIADLYYHNGKKDEAINHYKEAIKVAEERNINHDFQYDTYRILLRILVEENRQNELTYYRQKQQIALDEYYAAKEQFYKINNSVNMALMKAKMTEIVNSRNQEDNTEMLSSTDWFIASIALFAAVLFMISSYYRKTAQKVNILSDLRKIGIESNV